MNDFDTPWDIEYAFNVEKREKKPRNEDDFDEAALRDAYEHLMGGEGWSRFHVELPALRKGGHAPKEGYGKTKSAAQARRDLKAQEMVVGTYDRSNLVSSQCTDGFHRLCIDVDRKCEVLVSDFTDAIIVVEPPELKGRDGKKKVTQRLAPRPVAVKGNVFKVDSSSEDCYHLYSDHPYTWAEYAELLETLGKAGVIEKSYYLYSIERGFTTVRKPWVRKIGGQTPPKQKQPEDDMW